MQSKCGSYSSIRSAVNDADGWVLASVALGVKFAPDSIQVFLARQRVSKANGRPSQGSRYTKRKENTLRPTKGPLRPAQSPLRQTKGPLRPKEDPLRPIEGHQARPPQTDRRLSHVDKGYTQADTRPQVEQGPLRLAKGPLRPIPGPPRLTGLSQADK